MSSKTMNPEITSNWLTLIPSSGNAEFATTLIRTCSRCGDRVSRDKVMNEAQAWSPLQQSQT